MCDLELPVPLGLGLGPLFSHQETQECRLASTIWPNHCNSALRLNVHLDTLQNHAICVRDLEARTFHLKKHSIELLRLWQLDFDFWAINAKPLCSQLMDINGRPMLCHARPKIILSSIGPNKAEAPMGRLLTTRAGFAEELKLALPCLSLLVGIHILALFLGLLLHSLKELGLFLLLTLCRI